MKKAVVFIFALIALAVIVMLVSVTGNSETAETTVVELTETLGFENAGAQTVTSNGTEPTTYHASKAQTTEQVFSDARLFFEEREYELLFFRLNQTEGDYRYAKEDIECRVQMENLENYNVNVYCFDR